MIPTIRTRSFIDFTCKKSPRDVSANGSLRGDPVSGLQGVLRLDRQHTARSAMQQLFGGGA